MKKTGIIFLVLGFVSLSYGADWEYKEDTKQLLYLSQPFPVYQNVVTPIGMFGFEKFGANPFSVYGWFKMKQDDQTIKTEGVLNDQELKRGWKVSLTKPSNLPQNWIYFPQTNLYSDVEPFFRLNRFWNDFYDKIEELSFHIYNKIEKESFYRIETEFLENNIRDVIAVYPKEMVLIFEKKLTDQGIRKLFVFYTLTLPEKPSTKIDQIELSYIETDGRINKKKYKLIYQKDSRLVN